MDSKDFLTAELELAKLYVDRGDFHVAIPKMESLVERFCEHKDYGRFIDCNVDLIRMYTERDEIHKIGHIKERLQELVLRSNFHLTSFAYFALGVYEACNTNFIKAQEHFQTSLSIALKEDDKKVMSYAIAGLAYSYTHLGKISEAIQEIYNLRIFLEILPNRDLQVACEIFNGAILRKMGQPDQALDILWKTYDILSLEKNHFMSMQLLYNIGLTYQSRGDIENAKIYLRLLKTTLDHRNFVRLSQDVSQKLEDLGVLSKDEFDIVLNRSANCVIERNKGKISLDSQQIVKELLTLFVKHPGRAFSKEQIVRRIWNESYSPAIHDNKIYVTIRRIRSLIEPQSGSTKYIFKSREGYYLNKKLKVKYE